MTEKYNNAIAYHYSAYRPPLHKIILTFVLTEKNEFDNGLDIGCGTGYSAIALSQYCNSVCGIDPSQQMLNKTISNNKISYKLGTGENLPIDDNSVDIITFAGSLFYTKSDLLVNELKRVSRNNATIIVYDFQVILDNILSKYDIHIPKDVSNYNHETNFSNAVDFTEIIVKKKQINLKVSETELAHILLSNSNTYEKFTEKYSTSHPFDKLVNELRNKKDKTDLITHIYFSKYSLVTN